MNGDMLKDIILSEVLIDCCLFTDESNNPGLPDHHLLHISIVSMDPDKINITR